jgi:acetyl esterase/lipase
MDIVLGARLAAAVLALGGLIAQAAPPALAQEPEVPAGGRYLEPVFDDVTVTYDVPFHTVVNSRGETQTLRLDLYEPAGDTAEQRPVVLMMSGGFLNFIYKSYLFGAGEAYARAGYVVASIEYRVRPEMDMSEFPEVFDEDELTAASLDAYDDALAATAWLRDHAAEHRLDTRALVAAGGSAGGSIAWHLAWLPGGDVRPGPPAVAAALPLSAAPLNLAVPTAGAPPVLAFHGTDDTVIPYAWATDACARAVAVGARCDVVAFEGAGHPAVDPSPIVPQHNDEVGRRAYAFIAGEVLAPLGYFGAPEPAPDPVPEPADPAAPAAPGGPTLPEAAPAAAVPGRPTYTG